MASKSSIVFVRHGESEFNRDNILTGWCDPDLTNKGQFEAREAGKILKEHCFEFDVAFTSVLKRAIKTLFLIQDELDCLWIPVTKTWQLNERHFGQLQGKNKEDIINMFGQDQFQSWRHSAKPPQAKEGEKSWSGDDRRYSDLSSVPAAESRDEMLKRCMLFWNDCVVPVLKSGKRPIICGHSNVLRNLVNHLDTKQCCGISDLSLPNALPLVLELDENFCPVRYFFLDHESKTITHLPKKRNTNS